MTRAIGRRVGVIVVLLALSALTAGAFPGSAGAEGLDPCKVLKKKEIAAAFGGPVSAGKQGIPTPVSKQCEFTVSAAGDRPTGTVIVHVTTTGAKAAYDGLKKTSSYEPIGGVPKSLWSDTTHVVDILQGGVLLGVQGNFLVSDPLPLHFYDAKTQLTQLAQTGATRV